MVVQGRQMQLEPTMGSARALTTVLLMRLVVLYIGITTGTRVQPGTATTEGVYKAFDSDTAHRGWGTVFCREKCRVGVRSK
jgi:hypothetical protein